VLALIATLTMAIGLVAAGTAIASNGGASLGGSTPSNHHRAGHRHARHRPARRHHHRHTTHPGPNPLQGRAMWIWELSSTDGGNLADIIAGAKLYGVNTVVLKSSDGGDFWSDQFTPAIVHALHAGGLKVCAWQYVYGASPAREADLGAEAVRDGADCLVIDAEAQY
jgi:hypothetical protein